MEKKITHNPIYFCKRLRMLEWLRNRGYMPFKVMPDANNPKYNVFLFENTPELERDIELYFEELKTK